MLKCTPTVDTANYNKQQGEFCYTKPCSESLIKMQPIFTVRITTGRAQIVYDEDIEYTLSKASTEKQTKQKTNSWE